MSWCWCCFLLFICFIGIDEIRRLVTNYSRKVYPPDRSKHSELWLVQDLCFARPCDQRDVTCLKNIHQFKQKLMISICGINILFNSISYNLSPISFNNCHFKIWYIYFRPSTSKHLHIKSMGLYILYSRFF